LYNDATFASKCKALGIDLVPLVSNLSPNGWSDAPLREIIKNPTQFANALVSLCKTMGYPEIQLDWESGLTDMEEMTSCLTAISNIVHQAGYKISLTSYLADYQILFNTYQLAPILDNLSIQAYTNNFTTFQNQVDAMLSGMPQEYRKRLQVGMGDYTDASGPKNSQIAGQCVQYIISKGLTSLAIWPAYGTELTNGGNGYSDAIYGTYNFGELCYCFLGRLSGVLDSG
jgi:hypothetical protein